MTFAKRLQIIAAAAMLAVVAVSPAVGLAQGIPKPVRIQAAEFAPNTEKGFCSRLLAAKAEERVFAHLEQMQVKLKARRGEVGSFVASRRSSRDAALSKSRGQLESRREAAFSRMDEVASAPAQKEAVTAFRAAVQAAIGARQAALDKALQEFRTGLDKARADRQAAVDAAVGDFAKAVKAAEEKAKADCALKDADSEVVRAAMRTSIETARQTMKDGVRGAEKLGEQVPALAQVRQAAFEKALNDYRQAINDAKTQFKSAVSSN